MTQTPNLGLTIPAPGDWADIDALNANFQAIDDFADRKDNPHKVTAEQAGAVPTAKIGQPNGVASLNEKGKIPSAQLPAMDYIPTKEKGQTNGVASLGTDGKVPVHQLPTAQAMGAEPAGSCAAVEQNLAAHRNSRGNPHGVTPEQIGAQRTLRGVLGQFVGFNASGAAVPQNLPGNVIVGNYVGELSDNPYTDLTLRHIDLGVKPKAVLIIKNGTDQYSDGKILQGGIALDGYPVKWRYWKSHENPMVNAIAITATGFTVAHWTYPKGSDEMSFLNYSGNQYRYIAWL